MRTTHTYVILDLSPAAYDEIAVKLRDAGYAHAFHWQEDGIVIDMHGIAVGREVVAPPGEPGDQIARAIDLQEQLRAAVIETGGPDPRPHPVHYPTVGQTPADKVTVGETPQDIIQNA